MSIWEDIIMMYVKGREVRHDEEEPLEAFFWLVALSISLRSIVGTFFFRSNYYIPFINKSLSFFQGWFLFGILSIANAVFFIAILDMERGFLESIKCSVIPTFISALIFYSQTYKRIIITIAVLLAALVIFPIIQYIRKSNLARRKGKRLKKLKVFRRYARESYSYVVKMALISSVVFVISVIFVPSVDGRRAVVSSVKAATYTINEDSLYSLLEQNKDTLIILQDYRWEEATEDERMDCLQTLLNCEISYFGLTKGVDLEMKEMGAYRAGYYSSDERTAYISPDSVNGNPEEACETTLHEGRHAYQHDAVKYALDNDLDLSLAVYSDIREWKKNIDDYYTKDGEMNVEEFLRYKTQALERDANEEGYNVSLLVMSYIDSWE